MALHLAENGCYGIKIHPKKNGDEIISENLQKVLAKFGVVKDLQLPNKHLAFAYYEQYDEARCCLDQLKTSDEYSAWPGWPKQTTADDKSTKSSPKSALREDTKQNAQTKSKNLEVIQETESKDDNQPTTNVDGGDEEVTNNTEQKRNEFKNRRKTWQKPGVCFDLGDDGLNLNENKEKMEQKKNQIDKKNENLEKLQEINNNNNKNVKEKDGNRRIRYHRGGYNREDVDNYNKNNNNNNNKSNTEENHSKYFNRKGKFTTNGPNVKLNSISNETSSSEDEEEKEQQQQQKMEANHNRKYRNYENRFNNRSRSKSECRKLRNDKIENLRKPRARSVDKFKAHLKNINQTNVNVNPRNKCQNYDKQNQNKENKKNKDLGRNKRDEGKQCVLVSAMDAWVAGMIKFHKTIIPTSYAVIINLPLNVNAGMVYNICNNFVQVIDVVLNWSNNPYAPPYAIVYTSQEESETLKSILNGKPLKNKILFVTTQADLEKPD